MKLNHDIKIYGDLDYHGNCPSEAIEQVTMIHRIRNFWPETIGRIALHPRNEAKRHGQQITREKSEGLTTGASDLIIPGMPSLVLELKRRDHRKSTITEAQIKYLLAARANGSFVCIALGCDAALEAIKDYLRIVK